MTRTFLRRVGQWLLADRYRLALLGILALYVVVFAGLAFDLHAGMRTHRSDLGTDRPGGLEFEPRALRGTDRQRLCCHAPHGPRRADPGAGQPGLLAVG
jgi:hypothetical protein